MAFGESTDIPEIPEAWRNRTGKYSLLNKGNDSEYFGDSELLVRNGILQFRTKYFGRYCTALLRALNDTEAVIMGVGRGM
ncbi:MAG: hypothetical protein KJ607_13830 [Bacteroidetes bacterium]|nr:hypothetical protein [Bacteroidota bacterium]